MNDRVPRLKEYFSRKLTARETMAALLVVAALTSLGYLACQFIAGKVLQSKVRAGIPRVCEAIRDQRQSLVRAIESYRNHFGVYPFDNVITRQPLLVDAINNPLLYELAGVNYNPTNETISLGRLESAEAKYVKRFFHCEGFKNYADKVNHFLPTENLPVRQLHDDPDVFVLAFNMPYEIVAPELIWEFETSAWRYVSSSPTNNPGRFDLWIELKTKWQTITIGNWKAAE